MGEGLADEIGESSATTTRRAIENTFGGARRRASKPAWRSPWCVHPSGADRRGGSLSRPLRDAAARQSCGKFTRMR
jgi:hypothetical protein